MREHKDPTHILTIEVSLNVVDDFDYNPIAEAIRAIMPITKLGVDGAICGDVIFSIREATP